jgi:hypothetical protein
MDTQGVAVGARQFIVKAVASTPAWTGTLWAIGCKHLASAEALFDRKAADMSDGGAALLLIDRQERVVVRSVGAIDAAKVADYFGW